MRTRPNQILFYLNDKELKILNQRLAKTGLSREAYLRSLIENTVPKELPPMDFYDVLRELRQISINMNTPDAVCDSLMFIIVSSTLMNSSSVLYIDDIGLSFANSIDDYNKFPGSVYPTPASDRLYFHPNSDQPYTWTLTDLTGKTLLTGEAVGETSINTKDCATGVYLLQISGDGISGTRKVMIR